MPLPTTPAEWQKLADLVMAYGGNPKLWKDVYQGGWDPARYNKEITMTMREGPYKSSTHGPIKLSMRGRELLAAERDAVQGAIRSGDFRDNGQALSRARGDIAQHIADLELTLREKLSAEQVNKLAVGYGAGNAKTQHMRHQLAEFPRRSFEFVGFDPSSDFSPLRYKKDTIMTEKTEQTTPAPKTRSEILTDATRELVQAQTELEYILKDAATKPAGLYVGSSTHGYYMKAAVTQLVLEQWNNLAKKAVARAKARVAKAEKAVAALLAG